MRWLGSLRKAERVARLCTIPLLYLMPRSVFRPELDSLSSPVQPKLGLAALTVPGVRTRGMSRRSEG